MGRYTPAEIEHPEAYAAAIKASIHGRANAKREREWRAANPQLAEWVFYQGEQWNDQAQVFEYKKHPLGYVPTFIREAVEKWGAPTPNATATLQRIYDERVANNAKRAEQRAAEAASATAWTAGRQVVEGVVISIKATPGFGYHAADVYKWLVKRDDGSRIYTTIPSGIEGTVDALRGKRVRFTITVEPKPEEPTFAFGKRPAKAEIITPSQEASE